MLKMYWPKVRPIIFRYDTGSTKFFSQFTIYVHSIYWLFLYVKCSSIPHRPVHDGSVALLDLADSAQLQRAHLTPGTPLAIGSSVKQTAT